jgi:signal peptidase II
LSKSRILFLLIFIIILADQILKFWIKLNMTIGQEFVISGNWFIIHFTENEGMAFGLTFGGEYGKLALSLFRLAAIIAIGWYLYDLNKKRMPFGFLLSISLIFAGALGNLIDSAFYGMIFSGSSYHSVAKLFPEGGGYSSFLHGKVVDMFYFPVIQTYYPSWFPFWGGEDFIFFRPVFNIADSSITVGVFMLLLFYRKHFSDHRSEQANTPTQEDITENDLQQNGHENTEDLIVNEVEDENISKPVEKAVEL